MSKTALSAMLLSIVDAGSVAFAGAAHAQYLGNVGSDGETGKNTLEEALQIQAARVNTVQVPPGVSYDSPYSDVNDVFVASAITGAVFGGTAAALLLRSRSGKYAVSGRG